MAINAVRTGLDGATGMALHALLIEKGYWRPPGGLVRAVTRQARQRTALQKATALAEIYRLMADIPRIIPIDQDTRGGRRPVAFTAKVVYRCRREFGRIGQLMSSRIGSVIASRAVACFTANSEFVNLGIAVCGEAYRTRRMALETALHPRLRVGNPVQYAGGFQHYLGMQIGLSRSGAVRVRRSIPGSVMLHIPFLVYPRNERHGLPAGAERPFERQIHNVAAIVDVDAETTVLRENLVFITRAARQLRIQRKALPAGYSRKSAGMRANGLRGELR